MYTLLVRYREDLASREKAEVKRAVDVLTRIPWLLAAHSGRERIDVMFSTVRLLSVDCKGNRVE